MTTDQILRRFNCVRPAGINTWSAQCPAHDDQRNSLSISAADDGRTLIFCHACGRKKTKTILKKKGLTMSDLFSAPTRAKKRSAKRPAKAQAHHPHPWPKTPPRHHRFGRPSALYRYRDAQGRTLYANVRFKPKAFRPVTVDDSGKYDWHLNGAPRVLYRLPELLRADRSQVIFIVEGEKDADALAALGLIATTNIGGAGKWLPEYSDALQDRPVVILPDNDDAGRDHARTVAAALKGIAASVHIVELPGLPPKGDVSDWLAAGGTAAELRAECDRQVSAQHTARRRPASSKAAPREMVLTVPGGKRPQADWLIALAEAAGIDLFHTPGGDPVAYATIPAGDHRETMRVASKAFRTWLARLCWAEVGKAAGGQAMQDALAVLSGRALFEGRPRQVALRLAQRKGAIYLDLADDHWRAVRVTADGWEVVKRPPVRFVRPRGMLPLPLPERGGSIADLRPFVNVGSDDDFLLLVACLIAYLRPRGPFPVLALYGEAGSAKSTTSRVVRALIDSNRATLRRPPREERDLMIAANNSWVLAFENLSSLPDWLSDTLAVLATGGGMTTRELYTDDEEKIFDAQRPLILNGIAEVVTRGDLASRTVALTLPRIGERRRMPERKFWSAFTRAQPRILGALLDAVAAGLRNLPHTRLSRLPRMADFALWASACEPALGVDAGAFMRAYAGNQTMLNETALEACVIVPALRKLLSDADGEWSGSATRLLASINGLASDDVKKQKGWPAAGNKLSGMLRSIAPNLRTVGIKVEFDRVGAGRARQIRLSRKHRS